MLVYKPLSMVISPINPNVQVNSHQGVRHFSPSTTIPPTNVNLGLRTDPFESIPVYEHLSEHLRWFKYCWTNYLFENEKISLGVILGPCRLLLISNFPCTDHIIPVNHQPPRSWHNSHRRKWLTLCSSGLINPRLTLGPTWWLSGL